PDWPHVPATLLSPRRRSDRERSLATAQPVAFRQLLHPMFSQVGFASEKYGVWSLELCTLSFVLRSLPFESTLKGKFQAQSTKLKVQSPKYKVPKTKVQRPKTNVYSFLQSLPSRSIKSNAACGPHEPAS